jgi:hypothetical protein
VSCSRQGKTADAISLHSAAPAPAGSPYAYAVACAFAVAGDVPAAIRDFEQILKIDPTNAAAAVDALKKAGSRRAS